MVDNEIKSKKDVVEERIKAREQEPDEEKKTVKEEKGEKKPGREDQFSMPEMNFTTFVLMLGATCIQQLGKIANPFTNKVEKDLAQAKQTIDLLGILEEKTRGNLNPEEQKTLKTTLTNLRLNYLDELNSSKKG